MRDYGAMFVANAIYEGTYLPAPPSPDRSSPSAEIEIAKEVGADAVCHGATRQGPTPSALRARVLRLETRHQGHRAVARVGLLNSRTKLLAYAEEAGITIAKNKRQEAPYSMDANLLHRDERERKIRERSTPRTCSPGPWSRGRPRRAHVPRDRVREGRPGRHQRRAHVPGRHAHRAQQVRRRQRHRSPRHR